MNCKETTQKTEIDELKILDDC